MTVTRAQAQTLLAAVTTAQALTGGADLEGARLMLLAALERIGRQESKSMLRVPA